MDVNTVSPVPVAAAPTADEFDAEIAAAQAALRKAAERVGPRGDEAKLYLYAMGDALGILGKMTRRWQAVTNDLVAGHEPFPEADRARLIRDLVTAAHESFTAEVRRRAERMIRAFDRRTTALVGSSIGGAFVGGLLLGALALAAAFWWASAGTWSAEAAWAEVARYNPDPRPLMAKGVDGAGPDGRHYKVLSLWTEPARSPPAPAGR